MKAEDIIYSYEESVNNKNIEKYIALFQDDIQKEMYDFLNYNSPRDFFIEESREVIKIEDSDCNCAVREKEKFDDVFVKKVTEMVEYKEDNAKNKKSGEETNYFIFVKQDGKWSLYRISACPNETKSASLSCPTVTNIYFTNSANVGNYNSTSAVINFNSYLKNVLPREWYISYYYLSDYGKASAIASKMYAWYYTVYPKWNYAPFFACMKDNTEDQRYLYSSYGSLSATYKSYEDSVMTSISNYALVSSNGNSIFEIHYHATNGSYHSGQMSASGCLSKAQEGTSYTDILHYYYDKSSYIGTSNTANVISY